MNYNSFGTNAGERLDGSIRMDLADLADEFHREARAGDAAERRRDR